MRVATSDHVLPEGLNLSNTGFELCVDRVLMVVDQPCQSLMNVEMETQRYLLVVDQKWVLVLVIHEENVVAPCLESFTFGIGVVEEPIVKPVMHTRFQCCDHGMH